MDEIARGLEVGRRRILHPGPLRWLRALGWMAVLAVVIGGAQFGLGQLRHLVLAQAWAQGALPSLLSLIVMIGVIFGLYALLVRFGEDRPPSELDPRKAPLGLLLGVAIGVGAFCAVMAGLVFSGAYQITGPQPASAWGDVNMALGSGFLEELAIRAIIFRLVMRAFGVWPALLLSAALFGAGHLGNPNATVFAAVCIAIEAGLSLAALYLATGNVWAPIGFHVSWNFVQAFVFGAHVSGIEMGAGLWRSTVRPGFPDWLSGGPFGPEASAPALVAGSVVAIAAMIVAHRRGRLKALPDQV